MKSKKLVTSALVMGLVAGGMHLAKSAQADHEPGHKAEMKAEKGGCDGPGGCDANSCGGKHKGKKAKAKRDAKKAAKKVEAKKAEAEKN
jgi:hypothetical protein